MSGKEQFIKLPRDLLLSDSWRLLSINARRFLDFLMNEHMRQGGKRNGFLLAPYRQLYTFGIGAHFVIGAIEEVERGGLVECQRGIGRRPNYYTLTWLPMADRRAPSDRWRSVVHAVSTENACQTACTKPVVTAKQHAQRAKSVTAKQHAPSRRSYQGGGISKKEAGYSSVPTAEAVRVEAQQLAASAAPSAGKQNPEAGTEPELDPSRPCGRYVVCGNGHRVCGQPSLLGADRCPDHALRAVGA